MLYNCALHLIHRGTRFVSYLPVLTIFWLCTVAVLAAFYLKYRALNKKYGSKLVPAGHPYCWYAIVLQGAPLLAYYLNLGSDTVLSTLNLSASTVWIGFAIRDFRKTKAAVANAPAPIAHEGIPGWGLALKGLNHMYIDLSGIDTKTLVDSKIEIDDLKSQVENKLRGAGIEIISTKTTAKSWLTVQMKTQPGPKQTGSITTLYLQIGETLTNDRLDAINVRVNAPIFSTVTVAVCDGIPSAESISSSFAERLDQFIQERDS